MPLDTLGAYTNGFSERNRGHVRVFSQQSDDFLPTFFFSFDCRKHFTGGLDVCLYVSLQILNHHLKHEVSENRFVVLLTGSDESLYVPRLVFGSNLRRNQPEFKLNHIHQQPRHPAVTIGPRMYRDKVVVSVKTQEIFINGRFSPYIFRALLKI